MSELQQTIQWFKLAKPEPTDKDLNVQAGVHFEEVTEMLDQVEGVTPETALLVIEANRALKALADKMKSSPLDFTVGKYDPKELLDALCDQTVTATGVAVLAGMDFAGAMQEVNKSNYSKFVDGKPVFNEQGKIAKGPDFFRPDLKPFV